MAVIRPPVVNRCAPWLLGAAMLVCHSLVKAHWMNAPSSKPPVLTQAPTRNEAVLHAMGDSMSSGVLNALRLQSSDIHSGVSITDSRALGKDVSENALPWLNLIAEQDPDNQTALTLATHLLPLDAPVATQERLMRWVKERTEQRPASAWRHAAFAAWFAQHKMQHRPLALELAQSIRLHASEAPPWARQLEIFLHEQAGEYESAAALLGSMLTTEKNLPAQEQMFLLNRLQFLEQPTLTAPVKELK